MPAVQEDLDLSWVTFTEEDHELKCDREAKDCPNVAVWRVKWIKFCGCGKKPRWYCQGCYDWLKAKPGVIVAYCPTELYSHQCVGTVTPLRRT